MMEEPYIGTCCPVNVLGSSDIIFLSCEGVGFTWHNLIVLWRCWVHLTQFHCPVKVLGLSDTILLSCEGVGFIWHNCIVLWRCWVHLTQFYCPVNVLGSSDTILLSCEGVGFIWHNFIVLWRCWVHLTQVMCTKTQELSRLWFLQDIVTFSFLISYSECTVRIFLFISILVFINSNAWRKK